MIEAHSLLSLLPIGYFVLASLGCTKTDALGAGGNDDSGVDGIAPSGGSTGTGGTTVPALGGTPLTGGTTAGSGGSTATVGTTATPLGGTPSTCGMTGSSSLLDMLPPDNEVDTWVQTGGVSLITDQTGLYSRIDGGAPKYIDRGWVSSAYVNYSQGSRTIQVAIHDMGTVANAQAIYNYALPAKSFAIPGPNAVVDPGLASAYAAYAYLDRFYIELNISEKDDAALTSIELFMKDILDRISNGCPDAGSAPDSGSDGNVSTGGTDGAETGGVSGDCSAIVSDIVKQTQIIGTCTAVVRLDYASLRILGHKFICGKYAQTTTETSACDTANADVTFPSGVGLSPICGGTPTYASPPTDEWLFSKPSSDFGGIAAVSARSGLTVFAGTTYWAGTGEILFPSAWDTSDLGSGCSRPDWLDATIRVRSLDLSEGQATAQMTQAAAVVIATAIPPAFEYWGYVFDAVVLLYPRTIGAFDPSKAEYIVLLNGGWLE